MVGSQRIIGRVGKLEHFFENVDLVQIVNQTVGRQNNNIALLHFDFKLLGVLLWGTGRRIKRACSSDLFGAWHDRRRRRTHSLELLPI